MDEEKKNKKMKKLNTALFFILFVFSYILIFLIGKIILSPIIDINKDDTPENNIIEENNIINSNDTNQNDGSEVQNNVSNNYSANNNVNSDNNEEITENPEPVIIKVFEDGKQWNQINNLNIFANPYFDDNNVIAPGIKHRYNFDVQNASNKKIIYFIKFKEENSNQINLKYRLKKNNEYVLGDNDEWIYINNQTTNNYVLDGKSKEGYSLEWYWEDSDRDTAVGQDKNVSYKIDIEICSAVVEE